MKQKIVTVVCLLLTVFGPCMAERSFVHPGSILTKNDMERIRTHVEAHEEPWYSSWHDLQTSDFGNCSRTANPSAEIGGSEGTRQRASADAYAALLDAIQWHVTGQERYADHAVKLLSAWGNTVRTADAQLFQFPARSMCIAAEMLRYEDGSFYEGWDSTDLENFLGMVRTVLVPACRSQAADNPMTSWSAPAATGILAAGILLDDESLFDEGLGYYRSRTISGSVYNSIADNGQVKEMGRDNVHAMLTLNDLAQMAQLAWSQGVDIWGEDDNRLLRGFEYYCTYNMGHEDLDYAHCASSDGVSTWYYISVHNNAFRLRPDGLCYESVYHHYKEQKHVDMDLVAPHLTAFARLARPEAAQENLGFGTVLFTVDEAASPLMTEVPAAAEDLTAVASQGFVWLSWKDAHREDARGYRILRSTDGVVFTTLADMDFHTRKAYVDNQVEPGQTYYYKVVLRNLAGEAPESEVAKVRVPICGGLPDGWKTADIGNGWTTGFYTNSMDNTFVVEGGGDGFRRTDEGHAFVYHSLKGNGSLTVRMLPTPQTFGSIGIMLRGTLHSGSKQMGITLGGTGLRYTHAVTRLEAGGQTQWKNGDDFTHTPVWLRIVREGKTVSAYQSRNGEDWHLIQSVSMVLPQTVYVGMIVCASETYRAEFDHVSFVADASQTDVVAVPANLTATCMSGCSARLLWDGVYGARCYKVYRNGTLAAEVATNSYDDENLDEGHYVYQVSAVVDQTESELSPAAEVELIRYERLTGKVIGTSGSWSGSSTSTRDAVFDGDITTFFDAPAADGAWAGIDLGKDGEAMVTEIRFCPRQSHPERMVGGCFQGAGRSNFSDAVTLYTVSDTPATGTFTSLGIDDVGLYRYVRYIGPEGGYCNVAEVEFYGRRSGIAALAPPCADDARQTPEILFDLQGRHVASPMPKHGLYIHEGKKILIRG